MPAATCRSSTQSPTRTAATGPPLAARMTATRVRACCPVCNPTPPRVHNSASAANAVVSRVRAISVASPRRAGAKRSSQSRLGRITSAQISTSRPGLRCGSCAPARARPATTSRGSGDHIPPVGPVFRAAGLPPLLPAVAGVGLQPGQHGQHPQPARLLAGRVVQREGSGQDLGQHRGSAHLGRRPRRRDRARRERGQQRRPGRGHQPAFRRRDIGPRRPDHLLAAGGHDSFSPNRIRRLSARYPAAGGAAGSRSRCRAWKASTPAITSSVTGFR